MSGYGEPQRKPTGGEWVTWLVALVCVFGLFAAEVFTDFHARKYGTLMIFVFWLPLVALHELGHALAARLVGWRVRQLVVGLGRTLWRGRIGATEVEFRAFPLEGFVRLEPGPSRFGRFKGALVYFAGPGIELLLIVCLGLLLGWDRLLSGSDDVGLITLQALALSAAIGASLNLMPFALPDGRISDGMGLLLSLILPPPQAEPDPLSPEPGDAEAPGRTRDA